MSQEIDNRIADALYLLSRNNYWDACKIAYDVLLGLTFAHGSKRKQKRIADLERRGLETLCLLYDYLRDEGVANAEEFLPELHLLTVYFHNYSREALRANQSNHKVKVLALNLVGLVEFLHRDHQGSKYVAGRIDSDLIEEIENEQTKTLYAATMPYLHLRMQSQAVADRHLWEDLESFDPQRHPISCLSSEVYQALVEYQQAVETLQLSPDAEQVVALRDQWATQLEVGEVSDKLRTQYHVQAMHDELKAFRQADKGSGKYHENVYRQEKEAGFHKNVYPWFAGRGYDLVISEFSTSNQRHDILLYRKQNDFSCIVELKVNDLSELAKNMEQLREYLREVADKPHHYITPPQLGVLLIYSLSEADPKKKAEEQQWKQVSKQIYLDLGAGPEDHPVLIAILTGK